MPRTYFPQFCIFFPLYYSSADNEALIRKIELMNGDSADSWMELEGSRFAGVGSLSCVIKEHVLEQIHTAGFQVSQDFQHGDKPGNATSFASRGKLLNPLLLKTPPEFVIRVWILLFLLWWW